FEEVASVAVEHQRASVALHQHSALIVMVVALVLFEEKLVSLVAFPLMRENTVVSCLLSRESHSHRRKRTAYLLAVSLMLATGLVAISPIRLHQGQGVTQRS